MPKDLAVDLIQRRSGCAFDPDLTKVFIALLGDRNLSRVDRAEIRMSVAELCPGLVTARDVQTRSGVLLIPRGDTLTESDVQRLIEHDRNDPIVPGVFIVPQSMNAHEDQQESDALVGSAMSDAQTHASAAAKI